MVFEVIKRFRTQRVGMVQTTVSWCPASACSLSPRAKRLDSDRGAAAFVASTGPVQVLLHGAGDAVWLSVQRQQGARVHRRQMRTGSNK